MQTAELAGEWVFETYFPGAATAATVYEGVLFRVPGNVNLVITSVDWIPTASVTGQATNFFTLNVRNRQAGGVGTPVPAALAFSSAPVTETALVPGAITLSGTATDLNLAAGDVITAQKAVTGTGLACPDGVIVVHCKVR